MTRIGFFAVLLLVSSATLAGTLADIEALLAAKKPGEAYAQALEMSAEHLGDPAFDFVLGLAAIESGNPADAVLALERVLIVQPQNHRARLELARAYFLAGDYTASRAEFVAVLTRNPPANVRLRIESFLSIIDKRLRAIRWDGSFLASAVVGYDSNINAATSDESVDVPVLSGQPIRLDRTSREIADEFTELNIGGALKYKVSKKLAFSSSAAMRYRDNFASNDFDTSLLNAGVAIEFDDRKWFFRMPVQHQTLLLDGSVYRRLNSVMLDYGRYLLSRDRLSVYGQYGVIDYPDQKLRDANLLLGGALWSHRFSNTRTLISSSVYYGREDPKRDEGRYNGRDYYGLRVTLQNTVTRRMSAYGVLAYQWAEYADEDPVFNEIRNDDFYQASIGVDYALSKRVTLTIGADGFINNSNLELYDYDRYQIKGGLAYGF